MSLIQRKVGGVAALLVYNAIGISSALAGNIDTIDRVKTLRVPDGGEAVEPKFTPDGTIHLLYDLNDAPYYVRSKDDGATFSSPIPVVGKEFRKPGLAYTGTAMAVGKGGRVYVAMTTNNWKARLQDVPDGLLYSTLAVGAKAFTPLRSLNQRPVRDSPWRPTEMATSPQPGSPASSTPTSHGMEARLLLLTLKSIPLTIPAIAAPPGRSTGQTGALPCFIRRRPITNEICIWCC